MSGLHRRNLSRVTVGLSVMALALGVTAVGSATTPRAKTTSMQFAGYEVSKPKTGIKSVSVSFVVPSITCKKNFSGVGPSVLIDSTVAKKTNTYSISGGGVGVACKNHVPVFVAIPIVDSDQIDESPNLSVGDHVTLTVRYGSKTDVAIDDTTAKLVFTKQGAKSRGETAYIGSSSIQINHHTLQLDPFGVTKFSNVLVNGKPLGKESPIRTTWVDKHHHVLVSAGKITKHRDFTTKFVRST